MAYCAAMAQPYDIPGFIWTGVPIIDRIIQPILISMVTVAMLGILIVYAADFLHYFLALGLAMFASVEGFFIAFPPPGLSVADVWWVASLLYAIGVSAVAFAIYILAIILELSGDRNVKPFQLR